MCFVFCDALSWFVVLQGRLPIRVQLKGLTEADLYRILTEPKNNLIRQQVELMKTEGVSWVFDITKMAFCEAFCGDFKTPPQICFVICGIFRVIVESVCH